MLHLIKTSDKPFFCFLSGGAGVGKSHVTKALYQAALKYYNTRPGINFAETKVLRANVAKNQTFFKYRGNSSKINSAHFLKLGRPKCETSDCILCLVKYRFIFEKIDNNQIL